MAIAKKDISKVVDVILTYASLKMAEDLAGDLVKLQLSNQSARETFKRIKQELWRRGLKNEAK